MLSAVRSAAVLGIDAYDVTVEVDSAPGLPYFAIVGLPTGAVKESRERVSAALVNSGFTVPPRKLTTNLSPAHIPKGGTAFDLPIALGVLVSSGQLPNTLPLLKRCVFMGELGLDGSLRPVRGVLPAARRVSGGNILVVPAGNAAEATLASSVAVSAPGSLRELVSALRSGTLPLTQPALRNAADTRDVCFSDVAGQSAAKRALEIAAAGGHAVLLVGPPGAGKTMLARRVPSILPALTDTEALEVVAIQSIAGLLADGIQELPRRPFRAPHHTVSAAGLIGGGSQLRPGEVSLAHHGVLFLDELLEFPRHVLDAMRQPLEDGRVVIARAAGSVSFPSRFTLVGAMNPCLCGLSGTVRARECSCSEEAIVKYRSRLSGPLRDRIDLLVNVNAVPVADLTGGTSHGETSNEVRIRVEAARTRQNARFSGSVDVGCNARMSASFISSHVHYETGARELLIRAAEKMQLSARAYHRVIKVAVTIADLAGSDVVFQTHVAEALRYR